MDKVLEFDMQKNYETFAWAVFKINSLLNTYHVKYAWIPINNFHCKIHIIPCITDWLMKWCEQHLKLNESYSTLQ